jgi:hypothetical protein
MRFLNRLPIVLLWTREARRRRTLWALRYAVQNADQPAELQRIARDLTRAAQVAADTDRDAAGILLDLGLDTLERAHTGDRAAAQAISRFEADVERPAPALPRARNAKGEVFRLQFAFGETVLWALARRREHEAAPQAQEVVR